MAITGKTPHHEERKRFLIACEECSLERVVEGRVRAVSVGQRHRRETGHGIVVVEAPRIA